MYNLYEDIINFIYCYNLWQISQFQNFNELINASNLVAGLSCRGIQ